MAEKPCNLLKNGGGMEETKTYTATDVFTKASALTWGSTTSTIKKKGDVVACQFYFSGTATTGAGGSLEVGQFAAGFKPSIPVMVATIVNKQTSGQISSPASLMINTDGRVFLSTGDASQTMGNSSYPWCTSSGLRFEYTII